MVEPDEGAAAAQIALPAKGRSGLNPNLNARRIKHSCAIGGILLVEQLPAWHRNHARADVLALQYVARRDRDFHFGTSGEEGDLGGPLALSEHIGAVAGAILVRVLVAQGGEVLTGKRENGRPFGLVQSQF